MAPCSVSNNRSQQRSSDPCYIGRLAVANAFLAIPLATDQSAETEHLAGSVVLVALVWAAQWIQLASLNRKNSHG